MIRSPYLLRSRSQGNGNNVTIRFRSLLDSETNAITDLCEAWEQKLQDSDIKEDKKADIRATIGQARMLLASKGRMKQFDQLVVDSENNTGEKPITSDDLQGFWDLLNFQIVDVKEKFKLLEHSPSVDKQTLTKPATLKKLSQNQRCARPQAKNNRSNIRDFIAKQRAQAKQEKGEFIVEVK